MVVLKGSCFWKGVLQVLPLMFKNSRWLVREGSLNFWFDNWLGDGPIVDRLHIVEDSKLQVRQVLDGAVWNYGWLRQIVDEETIGKILQSRLRVRDWKDVLVWKHSIDGLFSTKSAWQLVRSHGTVCTWRKWLWQDHHVKMPSQWMILFNSLELSFSFRSKTDQSKKLNQEITVDASLSNWLVSFETTPVNETSTNCLNTISPEKSMLQGSNSSGHQEDRPILGALTMPIIGTVGTYWSHNTVPAKDSGSASSYKGIPNTTIKYREDKRVNWHFAPFETRLDRALKGGFVEAYTSGTPDVS
ncbi:hypothetical protein I3842_03G258400 [Carya illinoinensis]|uniref:Uncharacterized protein n=1 Tax=Carya illinoinensis TaxID=32201 RepID=A0A922JXA8_CARIL|nr:hypothetical protein I3842_03G258400 [Carya illinoinensis]